MGAQQIAVQGAAQTGVILASLHLIPLMAAGPIGAAAAGLVAIGFAIAKAFEGCGDSCILASQRADEVEGYLNQQTALYFAIPAPRPRSIWKATLNNVSTALSALRAGCSDPRLGDAGVRCINERLVKGGTAPWCPNPGHTGCDWVTNYYDPIANDPYVGDDPDPLAMNPDGTTRPPLTTNPYPVSTIPTPVTTNPVPATTYPIPATTAPALDPSIGYIIAGLAALIILKGLLS